MKKEDTIKTNRKIIRKKELDSVKKFYSCF